LLCAAKSEIDPVSTKITDHADAAADAETLDALRSLQEILSVRVIELI